MNCDTYLSMLATLPMDELALGDTRVHATTCRDCDRVTRVVAERERNMILAFGDLYPTAASGSMATRALMISRRQTVALYYRIGLGLAAVATVLFIIMSRRVMPANVSRMSETFRLQCLSPEQAAEVLRPIRSQNASISIRPDSPLGIIRVEAPPAEMARLRAVLASYDTPSRSQCGVKLTIPKTVSVP